MNYLYLTVCSEYNNQKSYGIALAEEANDCTIILRTIADISIIKMQVEQLVELCNELNLDPIHLDDVVHDFIA